MIYGEKVAIRQMEIGDEEYLYKWWNNEKLMFHATWICGLLKSKESIRKSIINDIECTELFPETKRYIICKKADLEPIGEMNYCDYDSRNQKSELGIKICEVDEQGKGYGEDALKIFIDFMFKHLNLNKIELTTMKDNTRAQNLYKKLGFNEIGIIRKAIFDSRNGDFSDVVYMDLLKEEWFSGK